MTFNDTKFLVIQAMVMRLNEKEALDWFSSQGKHLKHAQYYRIRKKIKEENENRKISFKFEGLWTSIFGSIDQLETIRRLSWQNARNEKDPLKNQKILESITRILPYTTAIMEEGVEYSKDPNFKKIPGLENEKSQVK